MRHLAILLLPLTACASPAITSQEITKDWRHPWAGATVGSSVTWKTTRYTSSLDAGGKSIWKETELTRVDTVTKADGSEVEIELNRKGEKEKAVYRLGPPWELEGTVSACDGETLSVGQKSFACTVFCIKQALEPIGPATYTKVWRSPEAPVWAVRVVHYFSSVDVKNALWTEELTAIDEVVKVGATELKCAVVRTTFAVENGKRRVETEWITPGIPGRIARHLHQEFRGDQELKEVTSVRVATAFEKE